MNINQLIILTSLVITYILIDNNYTEGFSGTVTKATCIERMLSYECLDEEKKQKLNDDCSIFEMTLPNGSIANISCEDEVLFDTLLCIKMMSEGACDCSYGRKQMNGICNVEPINIECPAELKTDDLLVIDKIKELETVSKKCEDIEKQEQELFDIVSSLETIMTDGGIIGDNSGSISNYIKGGILLVIILGGGAFYFKSKKK
jgi:hypothetical protein